jgi:hypothetical protein
VCLRFHQSHIPDGNLVCDGLWTNTWNGENRLIAMESRSSVPASFKKKLTLQYDFMGRRTVKKVESSYSGGMYSATNTTAYVWDGWNIVAEVGQGYTNFMTWGIDMSGTLQGAGGVGGLVMLSLNGTNCLPVYNGNGAVMGLVNSSDGSVVAEYEYSPAGVTLKATGPLAKANTFRL